VVPQPVSGLDRLYYTPPSLSARHYFWFLNIQFFSWLELLASRPTPNLEDQVSVFVTPRDRVAELYPWTLGSSGTSG
jgi:hypothetical protein